MNLKELKELFDLVLEKGITEFELEEKGVKVKIKKGHDSLPPPTPIAVTSGNPAAELPSSKVTAAPSLEKAATMEEVGVSLVRSPMVGTYYRAPEPSAPPFVNEGDRVKVGQVLCIIEAMKLMNELECEVSGTIREICVENAQPVEFGQVLFRVDPS